MPSDANAHKPLARRHAAPSKVGAPKAHGTIGRAREGCRECRTNPEITEFVKRNWNAKCQRIARSASRKAFWRRCTKSANSDAHIASSPISPPADGSTLLRNRLVKKQTFLAPYESPKPGSCSIGSNCSITHRGQIGHDRGGAMTSCAPSHATAAFQFLAQSHLISDRPRAQRNCAGKFPQLIPDHRAEAQSHSHALELAS